MFCSCLAYWSSDCRFLPSGELTIDQSSSHRPLGVLEGSGGPVDRGTEGVDLAELLVEFVLDFFPMLSLFVEQTAVDVGVEKVICKIGRPCESLSTYLRTESSFSSLF
mgnify:CR=1 FL=1